jgi:hypothetical protein
MPFGWFAINGTGMNTPWLDKQLTGFIIGLLGPIIGGLLFYVMLYNEMSLLAFVETSLQAGIQTELISLATVFNLLLFFIAIWTGKQHAARGIILATFIYVFVVLILKAF